jgi:hypothetical protein
VGYLSTLGNSTQVPRGASFRCWIPRWGTPVRGSIHLRASFRNASIQLVTGVCPQIPRRPPLPRCAGSLPANPPKTSSGESAQRLARLRLQPASVRTRGKSFLRGVQAPGAIATSRLSESWPRVKLIVPNALEWRNWQTQQTQNAFSLILTFSIETHRFQIRQPLGCVSNRSDCEGIREL